LATEQSKNEISIFTPIQARKRNVKPVLAPWDRSPTWNAFCGKKKKIQN